MQEFLDFLTVNESYIAEFIIVLLFTYLFFYYRYMREAGKISILKLLDRDASSLSEELIEQRANFWKRNEDKSLNKKMARFFLFLALGLAAIAVVGIMAGRIIYINSLS